MFSFPYAAHMSEIPSNPIFSLLPYLQKPGFISFAAGAPSPKSFPESELVRLTAEIMERDSRVLMQYGSTEGYPPLRESIGILFKMAGIDAPPQNIFITSGGQQAIDLLARLIVEPGDPVLVETPTYSATLQILKSHRAKPVGVLSDDDGIIPEDLERKIIEHRPKLAYIIPTFQNPTGRTLSLPRRRAVAELTAKYGVMLIEDDPYRELRYFGTPLPPIKTFDTTGNVIYITSTSKILCPGLRVGASLMPEDLIAHMTVAKQAADMHSSNLSQALVDAYLRENLLAAHLERIRDMYRDSLTDMLAAIDIFLPATVRHTRPEGGLFIWCEAPPQTDAEELLQKAMSRDLAFIPGTQYFSGGDIRNCFRLNFSNASAEDIRRGMGILAELL